MITSVKYIPSPEELEYRMYVLSLRQLSPINKACQGIHSCLKYALKYGNELDYQKYITIDQTVIMLDGGISQEMEEICNTLKEAEINFAYFREPDLNNLITSICFLADERVWNKEEYADMFYEEFLDLKYPIVFNESGEYLGSKKNVIIDTILSGKRLSL